MPGGLLNLVAYGNQNVILNGNPSKTFFKCAYAKYTNFGLQKFRIDFDGQRTLRMNESSTFSFKVPRYAELLMDTYLSVQLPTIWSPIIPPVIPPSSTNPQLNTWRPYEFKWIKNLGTLMIETVRFIVGGQVIQEFTGQYLHHLVERDFGIKKDLYYKMTGNVSVLNDPANSNGRVNMYPSVYSTNSANSDQLGPEPSIRGGKIYIPMNIWFGLASKMAFPLISLQYSEFYIEVVIRPVKELFVIRDVRGNGGYYHQANFNDSYDQFYRFLQPPPDTTLAETSYLDKRTNWAADIHLIGTYAFLTEDEAKIFASTEQKYLVRESYTYTYNNVTGNKKVKLNSLGLVCNWTWFFQRSDIYLRNEWSNNTNWPYDYLPNNLIQPLISNTKPYLYTDASSVVSTLSPNANPNPNSTNTNIMITGDYSVENQKEIMLSWGLLLDGKYRENVLDSGVFKYIEPYGRSNGSPAMDGVYFYNFCINTSPYEVQPSGAINISKFNQIEFEFSTYSPPLDPSAVFLTICDGNGNPVGVNKSNWRLYDYNYDLTVLEERYNILTFTSGNAGLMFAR